MTRCLVTGASGFVGANLTRHLLASGHDVHLILRPGYRSWRIDDLLPHVTVHQADIEDAAAVELAASKARPEWVFHLAAYGAYADQASPARMVETNLRGTAVCLQASVKAGAHAFINTGSSSEYGPVDGAPREDFHANPQSIYGATKLAATQYCSLAAGEFDITAPTLRLYSVYGPWEQPTRLVPTLLTAAQGGALPPLAHPDSAHDFVYVDDVVDAYVRAAASAVENPDQASCPEGTPAAPVFNIGTGRQTTLRELVAIACSVMDLDVDPVWHSFPGRAWDTDVWVSDPGAARVALGWQARTTLEAGLRATANWLTSQ